MKRLFALLFVCIFISCEDSDDSTEPINNEYLEQVIGTYELKAAYFEDPIDLNGDGVMGTDLYEQIEYCNFSLLLDSYRAKIRTRNYPAIDFDFPYSGFDHASQEFSHCIKAKYFDRVINIDSQNETITLVPNEYEENFMLENFRTELVDVIWENRIAFLTFEIQLLTPEGEWVDVIVYMEYEWVNSYT